MYICISCVFIVIHISGIGANFFGDILQPQHSAGQQATPMGQPSGSAKSAGQAGKLVGGDLDTSLANLTSNLNLGMGQGK